MNAIIIGVILLILVALGAGILLGNLFNKRKKKPVKKKKNILPVAPEITTSRKLRGSPRRER